MGIRAGGGGGESEKIIIELFDTGKSVKIKTLTDTEGQQGNWFELLTGFVQGRARGGGGEKIGEDYY